MWWPRFAQVAGSPGNREAAQCGERRDFILIHIQMCTLTSTGNTWNGNHVCGIRLAGLTVTNNSNQVVPGTAAPNKVSCTPVLRKTRGDGAFRGAYLSNCHSTVWPVSM